MLRRSITATLVVQATWQPAEVPCNLEIEKDGDAAGRLQADFGGANAQRDGGGDGVVDGVGRRGSHGAPSPYDFRAFNALVASAHDHDEEIRGACLPRFSSSISGSGTIASGSSTISSTAMRSWSLIE